MRPFALLALLFLGVSVALAHDVPVNPSTCTFDPLGITAPDAGLVASVASPTAADGMRIVYTVATATAQFQQEPVTPRSFTIGGVEGTLAFQPAFSGTLLASGDLFYPAVTLTFTFGAVPTSVTVPLTTSLAIAGNDVVMGAPMTSDGQLTLVGAVPAGALPLPLATSATLLQLTCQASPPPDLDQFAAPTTITSLAGVLSPSKGKLRGILRGGTWTVGDLTGRPAILRLMAGDAVLATVDFPSGFSAQSARHLVADNANGSRVLLQVARRRPTAQLRVLMPGIEMPSAGSKTANVQATLVVGDVLARGARSFRLRGGALRAGS
jgi:hypothetical protein